MNFKTTIFLLILLIAVGGSYFYMESRAPESAPGSGVGNGDSPDRAGTALFSADDFPTASVQSITIEKAGKTIVLTDETAGWQQTSPVRFALDTWKTEQLSNDAAGLRFVARHRPGSAEAPTLEDAGLAPPRAVATFQFDTEESGSRTIRIGRKLPLGGRGFAMVGDDPHIYVVSDALHKSLLEKKITDLRKTSLDAPTEGKARHILLKRENTTVELFKLDGQWAFGSPHSGRADAEAIQTLLGDIGKIYIKAFVDDDPQNRLMYGLETPQTVLAIQSADQPDAASRDQAGEDSGGDTGSGTEGGDDSGGGESEEKEAQSVKVGTLRIGAADFNNENFFATWSESSEAGLVVFTITRSDKEKFDKTLDELRDPRLTPIARGDIREIGIERSAGGAFKLLYREGAWFFGDPHPGFEADTGQGSELVKAIVDARATSFQTDARPDPDPAATITIAAIGRAEPDVLKVFALDEDKRHLVVRNNETTGYEVENLKLVFEPALTFRDREVFDLDTDQLDRLTIRRPDGVEFRFERAAEAPLQGPAGATDEAGDPEETDDSGEEPKDEEGPSPAPGAWTLAGAEIFETEALDELLDRLLPLRAERWRTDPGPIEAGFTIELRARSGEATRFLIDPETRLLGRWTESDSGPALAIEGAAVEQRLIDALDAEFRYRTLLDIQSQDIASVAVIRDGQSLLIRKDEDNYVGDGDEKIDQSAAAGLFDTLAGLRVERFKGALDLPPSELIRIRVEWKEGEPIELSLHRVRKIGYLTPSNGFELAEHTVEKLTADLIEAE